MGVENWSSSLLCLLAFTTAWIAVQAVIVTVMHIVCPSICEVSTLWCYTNVFIIIIIIEQYGSFLS